MLINKRDLIKVINNYIKESSIPTNTSDIVSLLSDTYTKDDLIKNRGKIVDAMYKSNLIESEGVNILNYISYYFFENSVEGMSGEDKAKANLDIQIQLIKFLCNVYSVDETRRSQMIKFWKSFGRHVANPATPFAAFTTAIGIPGFAVFLFFVMEVAWFTNKDFYYKLVSLDHALMNVLTLSAFERFIENFNKNAKDSSEEFLCNVMVLYVKPGAHKKLNLPDNDPRIDIGGKKYDMSGSSGAKNKAKENIKSLIFKDLESAVKDSIISTVSDFASQDPEALRKKEKDSIDKSGGKTAAKFNTLDFL